MVRLPPRSGWLIAAAAASAALVVLHFGIIVAGAPAYAYFLAGQRMVELAKVHSLLPTAATGALAFVFTVFAAYALAAAGFYRLPAARVLVAAIGCIYALRGALIVPEAVMVRFMGRPPRALVFAAISLVIGIVHLIGVVRRWHLLAEPESSAD
jgi:hypothetical protein